MLSIHIVEKVHCLLRPELWIDCSMRCGRRVQVIPFCTVAHSTPSLRPLVKNVRLAGVVCLLGEFCAACGVNVWLGNGKARHEPPDWRLPRGLLGLGGLRADAPSEARGACGERAGLAVAGDPVGLWQGPEIWWDSWCVARAWADLYVHTGSVEMGNKGRRAGEWHHRYEKPATCRPPAFCASWGT